MPLHQKAPRVPQAPAARHDGGFLSTPAITLRWLLRLRWGAAAGEMATIAGVACWFRLTLPWAALGSIIGIGMASNTALGRWMRSSPPVSRGLVAAVLAFDTFLLGGLLYFTGGPSNPFSVLFLVQVTVAALALGWVYTACVVSLSVACYASLFFENVPLKGMQHLHFGPKSAFGMHLEGMFIAFALAAVLVAYFVTRVSSALRERDAQLAGARRLASANERMAALSTLAAGAAHELGTPLATIAVASRELDRAAERLAGAGELRDDARLIRRQVDRCRDIVQRLSARFMEGPAETPERIEPERFAHELLRSLDDPRAARLEIRAAGAPPVRLPGRALTQAIVSLVKNALDASDEAGEPVTLTIDTSGRRARFSIVDRGCGIAPALLNRVGEPFFTTKPAGQGMGLGVFLARAFADSLGGSLVITSSPSEGTRATLDLPLENAG